LTREALTQAASEYARANKVIGIYGMGLTQHRRGVECVQMLSNLLLLRGNIGKPDLLPCRGRIELDSQAGGLQSVTTEDSTGYMHASHGVAAPASPQLLSEPAIVAGIAKATLPANPHIDWDRWVGSYDLIRDEIAAIYPEIFHDGFADGDRVIATTAVSDGVPRQVADLQLRCYDIPPGCLAGYYPECNPLIPLSHHAQGSFVPAGKSIPVRLRKMPTEAAGAR
jgi:anaerobic selenocysteine-containing dehydrogenase